MPRAGGEPGRAGRPLGEGAAGGVIGHQHGRIGALHHLAGGVLEQPVEGQAQRRRRKVHGEVDQAGLVLAGAAGDEGAAPDGSLDQTAGAGGGVGARDGGEVDAQLGGEGALGRQLLAGLQLAFGDGGFQGVEDAKIDRPAAAIDAAQPPCIGSGHACLHARECIHL